MTWVLYGIIVLLLASIFIIIRLAASEWGKGNRYKSSWDNLIKEEESEEKKDV
ncbi:hypothetical protein ABET51_04600 [Metabacillus fastidiosus]|uniref:hypothetical protein n=1 Tax=Metabacillus fastidiosus TaxID=1458 RepID=UPI002DB67B67|nr:hypothetical protein [Metabacillus fastidiosus]MEC2077266.1 hypothetical protein [Metabacillus fastidiosus]MED4534050.1 hypothetical protein [Metabacillus fastidiosus]